MCMALAIKEFILGTRISIIFSSWFKQNIIKDSFFTLEAPYLGGGIHYPSLYFLRSVVIKSLLDVGDSPPEVFSFSPRAVYLLPASLG